MLEMDVPDHVEHADQRPSEASTLGGGEVGLGVLSDHAAGLALVVGLRGSADDSRES